MGSQAHWYCGTCGGLDGPISDGRCDVCADAYEDAGPHVEWFVRKTECDRYRKALERIEDTLMMLTADDVREIVRDALA